jgi:hypothetical protein
MNIVVSLLGTAAVVLFGVAVWVMSLTPPEYNNARTSLVGFSVVTIITYLLWIGTAPAKSLLLKVLVGLACGIVTVGLLPVGLQWIASIQTRTLAEENQQRPRYFGVISPQGANVIFSNQLDAKPSKVEIGDSGSVFTWVGPGRFSFYGSDLTVEVINGEVKVSTQVRDSNGSLIAEMVRNEWSASPPPRAYDRNYSQNALEIISGRKVVLQVRVLPDRIQLQGEWHGRDGYGTRVVKSPNPARPGGLIVFLTPQDPDGVSQNSPQILRMFAYPSGLHLGQMRQ